MLTHTQTVPVKLLHIVGDSRFGGIASIILGLGRVAQSQGWQVDVLTTDSVFQKAVQREGLGLVDLDVIHREIRPFWDMRGLLRLYKFLRSESYQVVHTHTSKGGFVGRLAARLAGVPVIIHTAHGFAFHEGSPPTTRIFYSSLERIATGWCDRIVAVSEFHRQWALELKMCSARRILAIPNGVAEARPSDNIHSAEVRRQLGARCSDLLLLSIARLAADKGLEYLIQAAAELPRGGARNIRIVIAGEGPARSGLEQLASKLNVTDRVTFLGFRQDIGDLLAASDFVVVPSLREGLSISLLEAMAAGKPIVASSIGSQKEVASHGEVMQLVRPANAHSLKEGILRLVQDQALRTRLGTNARAIYERCYSEEKMLQSYWQLYCDLLEINCGQEEAAAGKCPMLYKRETQRN